MEVEESGAVLEDEGGGALVGRDAVVEDHGMVEAEHLGGNG
jgi:hypothetical protein